jgi:type 1 glutamine amidotransferase
MDNAPINGYLVCGGLYHDMDYARLELLKLLGEHERIRMRVAENYADVAAIAAADFLVTYTCDVIPEESQQAGLREFLARGGRWLALHGTNSVLRFIKGEGWEAPRTAPAFMSMLGSQFMAHPAIQPYRVEISDARHPLVAGLEPFDADDELYLSEYHGENHSLLHAHYRGEAPGFVARHWPREADASDRQLVLYLHRHGGGEVLYCTLGHCRGRYDMRPMIREYPQVERGSWKLPVYHEILRRGIRWAAELPN